MAIETPGRSRKVIDSLEFGNLKHRSNYLEQFAMGKKQRGPKIQPKKKKRK